MKGAYQLLKRIINYSRRAAARLFLGYSDPVSRSRLEAELKADVFFGFPELLACNYGILAKAQGLGRSMEAKLAVDTDGEPIPWYTYPAIEYIRQLDFSGKNIFEYGCGYSSLYWAGRAGKVCSVDHNAEWIEKIRPLMHSNQRVIMRTERDAYARAIDEFVEPLDVIIIDGVWRNECADRVLKHITPESIIILDNADWYRDVAATLRKSGFFEVSFNGFGPIANFTWSTSLFFPWASAWGKVLGDPKPIGSVKVTKNAENETYW